MQTNRHGVILKSAPRRPSHDLTIILPGQAAETHTVLVGVCNVCGAKFGAGQEVIWQRHVGDCARKHIDEIRAQAPSERRKGTPFDPNVWDPEIEQHMRAVGKRMLAERRLVVLPHERAGHS